MFYVFATRDKPPQKVGDTVTLKLVTLPIVADDGPGAITTALNSADLASLHLGGLVAIEQDAYTHKVVTVQLSDPPPSGTA